VYPFLRLTENSTLKLLNSKIKNNLNVFFQLNTSQVTVFNTEFANLEHNISALFFIHSIKDPNAHISFTNVSFE